MEKQRVLEIYKLNDTRNQFFKALVTKDKNAVEQYLHAEFVFTHADANLQNRIQFISDFLVPSEITVTSIQRFEELLTLVDNTALLTSIVDLNLIAGDLPYNHHQRFTEIYVMQSKEWKLLAIHATFIPTTDG